MSGSDAWTPDSWRKYPVKQQPTYEDSDALAAATTKLKKLPPLVHPEEIRKLKAHLADVQSGTRFLLQGGDCAERFLDCASDAIEQKLKILLQMSLVLTWGAHIPTVRIGRMAGQYAKPRSSNMEKIGDRVVPSFRGDIINAFDDQDRAHDPNRMPEAYFHSAATLNYIRALIAEGFADLHKSSHWDLNYVNNHKNKHKYQEIVAQLLAAIDFMDTVGVPDNPVTKSVDFFSSHEGLLLEYESALTRLHQDDGKYYNTSAHFLWIGDRTRQLDHAHVEFMRGIANPIGVKVGPTTDIDELVGLVRRLNPTQEPGKIVLITRFGADRVEELLPKAIQGIRHAGMRVVWQCDPMHGNTSKTQQNVKTRRFDAVLQELSLSFRVHRECHSFLGGVHFELTGDDVTECVGGPQDLKEDQLADNYTTYCDPRLNYAQSMEMAFRMTELIQQSHPSAQSSSRSNKRQRI